MSLRLVELCFDAHDPARLAQFWATALRWSVADEGSDAARVAPTDGTCFGLEFVRVADAKTSQNRVHLDLTTTTIEDQHETVRSLIELGASHVDIGQSPIETHVVLADPEGNEFCVIEPTNRFLGECGRLGAINCDGTQAAGYFWSRALGWPLVWDQDEETAIRTTEGTPALITWSGPPLMPKLGNNRLHLDVAASAGGTQHDEVARLIALGAATIDIGQGDVGWVVMADPDGNEFCVLS
jgi:predicted enzyme related to lactoylglutathione lyase